MNKVLILLLSASLVAGCASTTESGAVGVQRSQFVGAISEGEINDMAQKGYEELKADAKKKGTLDKNSDQLRRVTEISKRLIPFVTVFRKDAANWPWEVHVITSEELNAFCMPSGKIMFYSGIIDKLQLNDAQIAAIMGHEIAHALREHGRERMSQQMVQQLLLAGAVASGKLESKYAAIVGGGAALLLTLPNSRGQESEADDIGLELMARAGYDPKEAVVLWQKMGGANGGKNPPEFLSTHPADTTRIARIQKLLPKVEPLYRSAQK